MSELLSAECRRCHQHLIRTELRKVVRATKSGGFTSVPVGSITSCPLHGEAWDRAY